MHFSELKIYQISIQLEKEVYNITQAIPYNSTINQVDQIQRSSSSVSANIVEGSGRQVYPKDFVRFLSIALGSCDETQHHLFILYEKRCINKDDYELLAKRYKNLSVRILNFIHSIRKNHNL